jgi:hypothetical protein
MMDTKAVHIILHLRSWVEWKTCTPLICENRQKNERVLLLSMTAFKKRQKSSFLSLQEMISDLFSHNVGVGDRIVLVQFCWKYLLWWSWLPYDVLRLLRKELPRNHICWLVHCLFVLRRDFHLTLVQGCESCLRWGLVNHWFIMSKTPCSFICIFLCNLGLGTSLLLTIVY